MRPRYHSTSYQVPKYNGTSCLEPRYHDTSSVPEYQDTTLGPIRGLDGFGGYVVFSGFVGFDFNDGGLKCFLGFWVDASGLVVGNWIWVVGESTDPFILSTPLYYVNAPPYMGSAYTTIAVDDFARFQERKFYSSVITGTDERGERIAAAASVSSPS
ncbi:hypothetical protein Ddye_032392 [Dipteronia dyeriana]|uniref:Methionyl/Leucyl tRNA synthetase domain-containing protein n=1 Tax=Dipteronia dyeriana TaxID=168575 RepID=A0AAD9TLA6_9ROSI|nr:hypothetical protein Ddye_032392 [Dipteronia dyeriana]